MPPRLLRRNSGYFIIHPISSHISVTTVTGFNRQPCPFFNSLVYQRDGMPSLSRHSLHLSLPSGEDILLHHSSRSDAYIHNSTNLRGNHSLPNHHSAKSYSSAQYGTIHICPSIEVLILVPEKVFATQLLLYKS